MSTFGRRIRFLILTAATSLGLAACGGGGGGIGGTGVAMGTLRLSMTDAPACGYDNVWVTVDKVRVHQSSTASDTDPGWSEVAVNRTGDVAMDRIDLLELRNGVRTELGLVQLPAGKYTQMRLVLVANVGNAAPFANAVKPTGGVETALDTPSGQQTGLKLNVDIDVPAGMEADFLLDFDACKSVVKAKNSGKYLLKPVIAVTPLLQDAGLRVQGVLSLPADALAATSVSVQASGPTGPIVTKATSPRSDGSFLLSQVPVGTYTLVVTAADHATSVMTDVPVVSGTPTTVSNTAVPIAPAPAASAARAAPGTVMPADATVRALQRFSGGPQVEVQWAPVDPDTGAFTFSLPTVAAQRTGYVADLNSITAFPWVTDASTPGAYTIEAIAADGISRKALPLDVLAPTLPALDFTFP